jgi:hypothetical protein
MIRKLFLLLTMLLLATTAFAAGRGRAADHGSSPSVDIAASTITGTVTHVNGSVFFLGSGFPGIAIDGAQANISGATSVASLQAGTRVFVTLFNVKSRPLVATNIVVIPEPELVLTGTLDSVDAAHSQFSLLGYTISVNADTVFGGALPLVPIKSLSNFAAGQVVAAEIHVETSPADAVTFIARKLTLIAPAASVPTFVRGVVHSTTGNQWTIDDSNGGSTLVTVNSDTKLIGSPQAGDSVEITVVRDASGALVALAIVNTTKAPQVGNVVVGTVQAITGRTWSIARGRDIILVDVNGSTIFVGDPKLGDQVQVRVAIPFVAGNLIAVEIRKL